MDGNGRWAQDKNLKRIKGHLQGIKTVREITKESARLGVRVLTLYSFSEENWARPNFEVSFLMSLLNRYLKLELESFHENGIRLHVIGNISKLPEKVQKTLNYALVQTKNNKKMDLVLALSYSGREEIINTIKKLSRDKTVDLEKMNMETFNSHLDTANYPDPDLLIRTGGEFRISNFLLWQIAYTEFYITDTYWPDFTREEFYWALLLYEKRERRFGKLTLC